MAQVDLGILPSMDQYSPRYSDKQKLRKNVPLTYSYSTMTIQDYDDTVLEHHLRMVQE